MHRFLLLLAFAAPPALAQSQAEVAFARQLLQGLQTGSFEANREFCGIIGLTGDGKLIASKPRRGGRGSCQPRDPRGAAEFIASFHTHAGFDEDYDSEVPSSDDVIGDMQDGLDGYLATPGGRLWFVDGQTGSARQICGLGCLPQDPDFTAGIWGPVSERYSLGQLEAREAE